MSSKMTWKRLCEYAGLSDYEAKVYVSLVEAGAAKARKLSAMCGVPRTKVYGVLKKLTDMGLVVEIPEDPRKFAPKPPRDAFEAYLKSYQNKAKNLLLVVSSLERAFKKAKETNVPQKAEAWVIRERPEILRKIGETLSKAKRTVKIITNENGSILLYRRFNRLFDELKERSIKVRVVTPIGSNNRHALNELRYTCSIELLEIMLPIIFVQADENYFILVNLKPDNFSLSSKQDKAIFSNDQNLCEMFHLLLYGRAQKQYNSLLEGKMDLATT
ncbi:MAG: TrmB family transcriptional regulator [Candidatus Bathyarchaeia archaeon]